MVLLLIIVTIVVHLVVIIVIIVIIVMIVSEGLTHGRAGEHHLREVLAVHAQAADVHVPVCCNFAVCCLVVPADDTEKGARQPGALYYHTGRITILGNNNTYYYNLCISSKTPKAFAAKCLAA